VGVPLGRGKALMSEQGLHVVQRHAIQSCHGVQRPDWWCYPELSPRTRHVTRQCAKGARPHGILRSPM
jgi:hypothetical protein